MAIWGGREGTKQIVITWTFLLVAFVVLLLRVITRVRYLKNFGLEDYIICAAFVRISQHITNQSASLTLVLGCLCHLCLFDRGRCVP